MTRRSAANVPPTGLLRDARPAAARGRRYVVALGIDRYRQPAWEQLRNAVNDARGAIRVFERLGFESKRTPLLDHAATRDAFDRLIDDLGTLGSNDSLVVFFAGHGHTETAQFSDGTFEKIGYLIPADGQARQRDSWVRVDRWLSSIAGLRPRHVLVILDCCHSGIALAPPSRLHGSAAASVRWRGEQIGDPLASLRVRQSRRVITSALDDQRAMDDGPVPGHSLFTGCLINALDGEMFTRLGRNLATGSEIWSHIRYQVAALSNAVQTPDFGALDHDDRGELIIERGPALAVAPSPALPAGPTSDRDAPARRKLGLADFRSPRLAISSVRSGVDPAPPSTPAHDAPVVVAGDEAPEPTGASQPEAPRPAPARRPTPSQPHRPLDPAFVTALDRHQSARRRGSHVVSVLAAEPTIAATGWATWAAGRGRLTLATSATGVDAATAELITAMPWLRLLPAARARLARTIDLEPTALDAMLRAKEPQDRAMWLEEIAGGDPHASVASWLLSTLLDAWGTVPDPGEMPVQGRALLSTLCELSAPVAVIFHHRAPDERWFDRALRTATELAGDMPGHAVAVAAPEELVKRVLRDPRAGLTNQRSNVVPLARAPRFPEARRAALAQLVHDALRGDPRTTAPFELGVRVPVHDRDRPVPVDLIAQDALLAIEIDDWYRSHDPQRYRAERDKDVWLQHAGFYVMRFLADDVEARLPTIVDEVALGLDGRRASGSFPENAHDAHAG